MTNSSQTGVTMSPVLTAYLQHGAALRRYLYRFVRNPEDVRDVAQEAFLRAYRVEIERPIEQPKSFLFRIAKHLALTGIESRRRWLRGEMEEIADHSVEDEAIARETVDRHMAAIAELPNTCRQVYWLRRVQGLSQQETSAHLGIAINTVDQHMSKASKRVGL